MASAPSGIFLQAANEILIDCIGSRILDGLRQPCDMSIGDFDNVRYNVVVSDDALNILTVHVALPCADSLRKYGVATILKDVFPGMEQKANVGYDFAVAVDLDSVKDSDVMLNKLTLVKRHLLGAPFTIALDAVASGSGKSLEMMTLNWRNAEAVYLCPGADPAKPDVYDRVVIVYSIDFPDEADKAFGRVFMQQFAEVSSSRKVNNCPSCTFSEENKPPLEIKGKAGKHDGGCIGYLSIAVFKNHVDTPAKLDKVVTMLVGLRNYLHYHIKASKTYLHMRMRRKVNDWLQVLNRSVMTGDVIKDKKTASGKTFTRK